LLGGILLVALNVLVEFGAFALLRFRTFTTELYVEYRTGFNGPGASLLAVVLLLLCLVCLIAEVKVRGSARYARLGPGTRRRATLLELGWSKLLVLAGFVGLVAVTLGVPLGMIVYWLTQHAAAAISPAEASAARLVDAALSSLWLGLAGAAVTVTLALPLGFLASRYQGWLITLLERAAYLAQGVPGIVVALALISLTVRALHPLYQTAVLLIAAYAIIFLPLALISVRAALMQAQRGLEEVARSLGLGWAETAWRVVLPLAGPGLGAAAALVFVSVVTELTTTLLLAPIGTETLATQVWADTSTLAFAAAAPYAALMVVLSLLSTWLLARRFATTRFIAA
jgi:iron(III) transport system permease protein